LPAFAGFHITQRVTNAINVIIVDDESPRGRAAFLLKSIQRST